MKTGSFLLKHNKAVFCTVVCVLFFFMLLLNHYTPMCMDDYVYSFNFETWQPIDGLKSIFQSIYAHAHSTNGRVFAHFNVQLFDFFPPLIFDFFNAGMFVAQLIIMCLFCYRKKRNPLILLLCFSLIWLFEQQFGLVNLWLTGSCNYLWGIVFGLLLIYPFYTLFISGKKLSSPLWIALFLLLAVYAGAYSEAGSAAAIFVSFLFLAASAVKARSLSFPQYFAALVLAFIGWLSVILCPAESTGARTSFTLFNLYTNFYTCLNVYHHYWPLVVSFFVMLILASAMDIEKNALVIPAIFFIGSLFANYVLMFSSFYPLRAGSMSFILLVLSDIYLVSILLETPQKLLITCAIVAVIPFTVFSMITGFDDIHSTGYQAKINEQTIMECAELGESTAEIPYIHPKTGYSEFSGATYLDSNCYLWPNVHMAKYYGVDFVSPIPESFNQQ